MKHRGWLALAVIVLVVIFDQVMKIWVKTHFWMNEDMEILPWFHLHFIENNGMAFGMEFGPKIFLTLFRVILAGVLIWYIVRIKDHPAVKTGFLICVALIVAGALGNIIDCTIYGLIFNNPFPPQVAQLFPPEGGYATLLHGRVVDMLYFPLMQWTWPEWIPYFGGQHFLFFQPIFNLADAAISVGMIAVLLFYSRQLALIGNDSTDHPQNEA